MHTLNSFSLWIMHACVIYEIHPLPSEVRDMQGRYEITQLIELCQYDNKRSFGVHRLPH